MHTCAYSVLLFQPKPNMERHSTSDSPHIEAEFIVRCQGNNWLTFSSVPLLYIILNECKTPYTIATDKQVRCREQQIVSGLILRRSPMTSRSEIRTRILLQSICLTIVPSLLNVNLLLNKMNTWVLGSKSRQFNKCNFASRYPFYQHVSNNINA